MTKQDIEIVDSLSCLYPLQDFEEEALRSVIHAAKVGTQAFDSGDLISRSGLLNTLKYNRASHTDENGETRQLVAVDINRLIDYVEQMPAVKFVKIEKQGCNGGEETIQCD